MASPSPDAIPVTRNNWLAPENLRWALRHSRQVVPTARVPRADKAVQPIATGNTLPLDDLALATSAGTIRLAQFLEATAVDAFLVLHRGQLVYERLLAGMTRDQPHQWASMTKSLTGLLASILAGRRELDPSQPLRHYVPELAESPFGIATVQQNLNMEVAVDWPADITELHWMAAVGLVPNPGGIPANIRAFLPAIGKTIATPHGSTFRYNNSSTEAVAWALCNLTGKTWATLVSDEIWSKLGAEQDAAVIVDAAGTAQASGGFSSTVGDLARLAEALRTGGAGRLPADAVRQAIAPYRDAEQSAAVVRFAAGNIAIGRPGFSYRNGFFHVNDGSGSFQMSGRFGQRVHINPTAEMTVVQFASYPGPGEETAEAFLAAMRAIAEAV